MKKHYRKETDCANCGTPLQGKFCYVCGQENLELKESFGHMMNHAISDYFHFDHQFFHTLQPLFFKPGKLTNEYMAGKRVQYLHPVKMYIFISLVYFVLLFKSDMQPVKFTDTKNPKERKELIQTKKHLDSLIKDPHISATEKSTLRITEKSIAKSLNKSDDDDDNDFSVDVPNKKRKSHISFWQSDDKPSHWKTDTTYSLYLATQAKLPAEKQDNFFVRYVRKREYELNESNTNVKEFLVEGIKHNIPKMMFLLLPLFALFLRVAFWKNRKFYVEHLIYSFHFHCFLFLFLSIMMLIKMATPDAWQLKEYLEMFAFIAVIWYSYKSLRTVYNRSPGRTITKMFGLFFSYSFAFALCMMILVVGVALFS